MKELIKRLLEAGKVDAETAETLTNEAEELDSKLKSARDESASRRQKLKDSQAQIEKLTDTKEQILEALGVDPEEELNLSELASKAKGKTEADEQLKLKVKRLERDLEKSNEEKDGITTKYRESQKQTALSKALSKHKWVDRELVEEVLSSKIEVTDEGVFMTDGVSLDDGIAQFANEKPHLLEAEGQGGSGYQGGNGDGQKNPWAKETRNLTEQARIKKENPQLAERLKSQAGG